MSKDVLVIDKEKRAIVKEQLEIMNNDIIEFKNIVQTLIESEVNSSVVVEILKKITLEENDKMLLEIKYEKDIKSLTDLVPRLKNEKALENFITENDKEVMELLLKKSNYINNNMKAFTTFDIKLENFIYQGEFSINPVILTKLRNGVTIFCKNTKQKQILNLVERLSNQIKTGIKEGLISDKAYEITLGQYLDQRTGDINYNRISQAE